MLLQVLIRLAILRTFAVKFVLAYISNNDVGKLGGAIPNIYVTNYLKARVIDNFL